MAERIIETDWLDSMHEQWKSVENLKHETHQTKTPSEQLAKTVAYNKAKGEFQRRLDVYNAGKRSCRWFHLFEYLVDIGDYMKYFVICKKCGTIKFKSKSYEP